MCREHARVGGFAETQIDWMLCPGRGTNRFASFKIIGRHKNGNIVDRPQGSQIVKRMVGAAQCAITDAALMPTIVAGTSE